MLAHPSKLRHGRNEHQRQRRHCDSLTFGKIVQAGHALIQTNPRAIPGKPVLTYSRCCRSSSGGIRALTRNIQLQPFITWVSTVLGVNCATLATMIVAGIRRSARRPAPVALRRRSSAPVRSAGKMSYKHHEDRQCSTPGRQPITLRPAPQRGTARVHRAALFNSLSSMSATIPHTFGRLRPLSTRLRWIIASLVRAASIAAFAADTCALAVSGAARALTAAHVVI